MKHNSLSNKTPLRKNAVALACAMALSFALPASVLAQESDDTAESDDMIIVTGTRMSGRSANDSPVPVDVIAGDELRANSSSDLQDMIRTSVPSFNVNTQPISDAATIVRPANVRGLSPDNVLVLVNGKRRHRGSIISFLGGGVSDGAQGVDISAIPAMALERVEVLRDGASSQYGSDAIAGVLNFILRDDAEGFETSLKWGSTYDGDGDNYIVSANAGIPLGSSGFLNVTAEIKDVEGTVRSVIRDDVAGMVAGGYIDSDFSTINTYTDQVPQYWGQPDVDDDIKLFFNAGIELGADTELYAFGNFGERTVTGGFFYRNPVTEGNQRGGVYAGPLVDPATGLETTDESIGVHSVLVGDMDGGSSCIDGIPVNGVIPDPVFLAQVVGDANCFSFIETIPAGFVPRFGGDNEDRAITVGIRGDVDIGTGLSYDFSATRGSNRTEFLILNTINASLGSETPRDFVPGGQEQTETVLNANFIYAADVGLVSDLNIAFGTEYREEQFDLYAGDDESHALGILSDQGFSSSSNGFGGFPNTTSAKQDSTALYVDLEADMTDNLTVQAAVRTEDFSEFGRTTDFKLAGIFHVTENFSVRAAYSTGFHAPTAGQANITNVTTQNVNGTLIDQGTLPLSSAAGQLAADFIESDEGNGRPTLGPEEAENYSIGVSFKIGESDWTVDYYNIEVKDRVALGANVDFLEALEYTDGTGSSFASVSEALSTLDASGVIDRQDFIALDDLSQFRFFSNSFDTTTSGIDIVGNYRFDLWQGDSKIVIAANYNQTEVDSVGTVNPIDAGRVQALEDLLPNIKTNVSWFHTQGDFKTMVRANYYGGWDDTGNGVNGVSAEVLVDVEVTYYFNENLEIVLGIENLFDTYPEENPFAGDLGQIYSEASPFGFNGGAYYLQARYSY